MKRCFCGWVVVVLWVAQGLALASEDYFATSSVAETRERIGALPLDDIWWTVPGEAMRWNNLNLAKFVPTVTVYRDGPVRPLTQAPNPAIGAFQVDTPDGPMSFDAFGPRWENTPKLSPPTPYVF